MRPATTWWGGRLPWPRCCNTCSGWDPNTDSPSDRANNYPLRFPTDTSDPRNASFDIGDVIPLDWKTDHKNDILRRLAPNGASPLLITPPTDATGLRQSVNRNITPAQTLWNLRSGYNVAALNCMAPKHAEILTNYRAFLRAHSKTLAAANRKVDAEFRKTYGARFIAPREKYMTEVYNHFALPPTLPDFCDAVLAMSRDALTVLTGVAKSTTSRRLRRLSGRVVLRKSTMMLWPCVRISMPVVVSVRSTTMRPSPARPRRKSMSRTACLASSRPSAKCATWPPG